MITLKSRYSGTLVGVLAGDALGAPYETKRSGEILKDIESRGSLTLFDYFDPFELTREIPGGHPTDDSELTAALAQSLAQGPFSETDVYHRLRGFIHGHGNEPRRSILTDGPAYGSGGTLRAALYAPSYEESFSMFRRGWVPVISTNGSLMRCAPVALRYHGNILAVAEVAREQSCITHLHVNAQAACVAYSIMLSELLDGKAPSDAWIKTRETLARLTSMYFDGPSGLTYSKGFLKQGLKVVRDIPLTYPTQEEVWPRTGDVILSLRVAVWATLASTSFRDGITKAICVGGDVDTYGAIAGGLLGARYGLAGIPREWREKLIGRDIMLKLAASLYKRAQE